MDIVCLRNIFMNTLHKGDKNEDDDDDDDDDNNNNNQQSPSCHPVAVIILHVYKIWNLFLINLSREDYMRGM